MNTRWPTSSGGERRRSLEPPLDRGVFANVADPLGQSPELVAAWVAWLRTFRWDWFATCAFGHPTSPDMALRAVTEWLAPLPNAYAAVGLQRGPQGDRLHVHAMIGGTGRHPLRESLLRGSWRRGSIVLDGYSPKRGAIEYLVRQADQMEIIGVPVINRPRPRFTGSR